MNSGITKKWNHEDLEHYAIFGVFGGVRKGFFASLAGIQSIDDDASGIFDAILTMS